jgi:diguanylate cyclase (GGDEF)-like protein/PAS domain S-box-containing protein
VSSTEGKPTRAVGVVTDITQRKEAELRATEIADRFSGLVSSLGDAVIGSTLSGIITSWNPAAETLLGWTEREALGRHLSLVTPADRSEESMSITDAVSRGETVRDFETVRRTRDNELVDVALTASPRRGPGGEVTGTIGVLRDITERRQLEADLRHQALHDPLTGLANRTLIRDRLEHALESAERSGRPLSVLLLDLDHFKLVNDAAGHAMGDQLLISVASRLKSALRPADSIARFGGDEFVVVCEQTDAEQATLVADRLQSALRQPIHLESRRVVLTASVGIAQSPPLDADVLLRSADTAMYHAKAGGRARASVFGAPMAARARAHHELSQEIREAIEGNELDLHYQPVVNIRTGEILGVEALLRWNHPTRGPLSPVEFVPIAEGTGLIVALDDWVLRRACADGSMLIRSGILGTSGHVAVNLGAHHLSSDELRPTVVDAVESVPGFAFSRLCIEVTETTVMADLGKAQESLRGLTNLGIVIALDDFGTGYSSLTYLQRLPIAILKIDRSFVQRLSENSRDIAIATAIVDLARAIGLNTVAEGVETSAQREILRRLNCDAGQGWLWSAARPLDELIDVVHSLPQGRFSVDG